MMRASKLQKYTTTGLLSPKTLPIVKCWGCWVAKTRT